MVLTAVQSALDIVEKKLVSHLNGQLLDRVRDAIGGDPPAEHSVHGLNNLPSAVVNDLTAVYQKWGSITAAAYLHHVTDASLGDIKIYFDCKGWISSLD